MVWQLEGGGKMRVVDKVIARDKEQRKLIKEIMKVCKRIKIMINYK